MARWLAGRLLGAIAVVLATVVACAARVAILVPDEAPRPGAWAGTVEGIRLKLLHGDFGVSHVEPGTVPVGPCSRAGSPSTSPSSAAACWRARPSGSSAGG